MNEEEKSYKLITNLKDLPEVVALELINQYYDYQNKVMNNKQKNIEEYIMMYQEILNDISLCLKENISIESKMNLINKEIEISSMLMNLNEIKK